MIKDVLKKSFDIYKKNWLKYTAVFAVIFIVTSILDSFLPDVKPAMMGTYLNWGAIFVKSAVVFVLGVALGSLSVLFYINYSLSVARGDALSVSKLFEKSFDFKPWLNVALVQLIIVLLTVLPASIIMLFAVIYPTLMVVSFALLVLGFVIYVFVWPTFYYIIDKRASAKEALYFTLEKIKTNGMEIVLFAIVSGVIAVLGALLFLVGFFFTFAFANIAAASFYLALARETGKETEESKESEEDEEGKKEATDDNPDSAYNKEDLKGDGSDAQEDPNGELEEDKG